MTYAHEMTRYNSNAHTEADALVRAQVESQVAARMGCWTPAHGERVVEARDALTLRELGW